MAALKFTSDFLRGVSLRLTLVLSFAIAISISPDLSGQTTPIYGIRDKTPHRILFTNARIVVSSKMMYDTGDLLIEDDHVVNVGSDLGEVAGATIVDLEGLWIYPGFIDAYTNYGIEKPKKRQRTYRPQYLRDRVGGSAWNSAIHAEVDWVHHFKPDSQAAASYMRQGVTTVMSVRQDGILRGRGFVTTLGSGLPNDLILVPLFKHCASFNKGSSQQEYPGSLKGSIALLRQVFLDVGWYEKAHMAYSANSQQSKPEFNAALEALGTAPQDGVLFETEDELSLIRAERIATEFGLPSLQVGSGKEYTALGQIAVHNPTLILPLDFPDAPNVKTIEDELDVSLADLRHWEMAPSNPAMVNDAGISFALTTHRLGKEKSFLENVRKAVKHGLRPEVALAALTTVPAAICDVADRCGTLEPGMLANLLVCDGDLLKEDATVHSVWIQGREYELEPAPEADLRGKYELSVSDLKMEFTIKGSPKKPEAEYRIGEMSGKVDYIRCEDRKLDFALEPDTHVVTPGVIRFSGRFDDDTLSGFCHFADGARNSWVAVKVHDHAEQSDSSRGVDSDVMISRLTYPNKAYASVDRPEQQDVLIQDAIIWTCEDDGVISGCDILVRDGRIESIGIGLEAPEGVMTIDAHGKHVTPGLIDAHSHLAISGDVNEGTEAISSEVRLADVIDPRQIDIYRQLAGGLTTVHALHGSANPIGGQVQVLKLKWGGTDEDLKFDAAPPSIKFALGENVKQSNWGEKYRTRYPQSRTGVEAIIRDAFQAAKEYESKWSEYERLGSSEKRQTIPPRRDLELEPLVEVLRSRMYIACHAYVQSEMLMMMNLAKEFGFTIRSFEHGLEGYKVAAELAAAPTAVATFSDWWAYKFEVYEAIPQNAGLLVDKGVVTAVKSDSRELARRINQEAAKSLMYTDISQEEALKTVTIYPARILMVDDRIGSLKEGKDADFVIWNGHPLSIYSHPEQTWIEGRNYFDVATDLAMRQELAREKSALIQKVIKSGEKTDKEPPSSEDKSKYDPGMTGKEDAS